ncbi:MAG: hypothetical protein R3348_07740 [Xanthomonadales bacterium]|nr:hypothetical protein [Xanthomonadales bacterium]
MKRFITMLMALVIMACGPDSGPGSGDIDSQAVSGRIEPDTLYRGYLVRHQGGICGLVLIEAGQFADDASIRFTEGPDAARFHAGDSLVSVCNPGQVMFADQVTGQSHMVRAPSRLGDAESFVRNHLETLLL